MSDQTSTNNRYEMWECPHCEQPGISKLRKLYLGPAVPASCQACGEKVGVPYGHAMVALLPLFIPIAMVLLFGWLLLGIVLFVIGAPISFWLTHFWVPLEARD